MIALSPIFVAIISLIAPPTGFGWAPSFAFYRNGQEIKTNFDILSVIPAITKTYFVNPVGGSDGNAGTSTGAALLNLATALAKTDVDQIQFTGVVANIILRTTKSWNNVQPTRSLSVLNRSGFRVFSAKTASASLPIFIAHPTLANLYKTTIASASAAQVIDTHVLTVPAYTDLNGNVRPLANVPSEPSVLPLAASAAALSAQGAGTGGWFHDGTDLHVRTTDDRNLIGDTELVLSTTGNNGRFGAVTNALTLYTEGIDFVGGNAPFLALTAAAGNTGTLAFNKCTFVGSQSSSNGLSVQGLLTVYSYRCGFYFNKADGSNYHSSNSDAGVTAGTSPSWFENECVHHGNGTTGSAATSDNASTSHDRCLGIRLNGVQINSDDRVQAESDAAMTWNMGVIVGQAVKTVAASESIAALINSKVWLDTCTALPGANPRWIAASAATINHYNSGPVVNAGTGEATGTIAAYVG